VVLCCCCCGGSVSRPMIRWHEHPPTLGIAGAGKTYIASRIIDSFLSGGERTKSFSAEPHRKLRVTRLLADIHPRTTICIDALDEVESSNRLKLLKSLKHLVDRAKNLVKIFATTRMDPDILLQFKTFPRIELVPDDNVSDINQFVKTSVQSAIEEEQLLHGVVPSKLEVEICETLCARSKGM